MKVLFLTVRADLGGGPEHLYQLLSNLPEDFEAWVACPTDEPYYQRYVALLGSQRVVEVPHRALKFSSFKRLVNLVRQENIEVIHSHGKGAGLYGRPLASVTRAKSVHTFHGLHIGEYGTIKKSLYLGLERALGIMTDRAICVSDTEAHAISSYRLVSPKRLATISNGVEVPRKTSAPEFDGTLKILAVSRYDYQKNPDLMLDVAVALKDKVPFELRILGKGERLEEIRERVDAEGLDDQVFLMGGVPSSRPFMRESHIFFSSSRWEGMPLAVLEAMSEGLCVVATDVVGNQDLIAHGETGLLYNTAQEGADAIASLTMEQVSRIATAARQFVEGGYSTDIMSRKTYSLVREIFEPSVRKVEIAK